MPLVVANKYLNQVKPGSKDEGDEDLLERFQEKGTKNFYVIDSSNGNWTRVNEAYAGLIEARGVSKGRPGGKK